MKNRLTNDENIVWTGHHEKENIDRDQKSGQLIVMRHRIGRLMMQSAESHRRSTSSADLNDNDNTGREYDHEWN